MRMNSLVAGLVAICLFGSECLGATWTISTPTSGKTYPRGTTNVSGVGSCSAANTAGEIKIVDALGTTVSTTLSLSSGSMGPPYYWAGSVSASPPPSFGPALNCTFQLLESGTVTASATVHFL